MAPPPSLRSTTRWLVFLLATTALALGAAHTLAERRAEEAAMSAELLAPPEPGAPVPVTDAPVPLPSPETNAVDTNSVRSPEAAPGPTVPTSAGGEPSIVPPELVGALVSDPVPAAASSPALDPALFADWSTYEEALKQSRATGRPVMLAFTALGCETCESLRASVFDDEAGSVTMRSAVIPVAVHDAFADTGTESRLVHQLQHDFGVTTFPTLIVWSPVTKRLRTLKGYRGAAATLRFIVDASSAVD